VKPTLFTEDRDRGGAKFLNWPVRDDPDKRPLESLCHQAIANGGVWTAVTVVFGQTVLQGYRVARHVLCPGGMYGTWASYSELVAWLRNGGGYASWETKSAIHIIQS